MPVACRTVCAVPDPTCTVLVAGWLPSVSLEPWLCANAWSWLVSSWMWAPESVPAGLPVVKLLAGTSKWCRWLLRPCVWAGRFATASDCRPPATPPRLPNPNVLVSVPIVTVPAPTGNRPVNGGTLKDTLGTPPHVFPITAYRAGKSTTLRRVPSHMIHPAGTPAADPPQPMIAPVGAGVPVPPPSAETVNGLAAEPDPVTATPAPATTTHSHDLLAQYHRANALTTYRFARSWPHPRRGGRHAALSLPGPAWTCPGQVLGGREPGVDDPPDRLEREVGGDGLPRLPGDVVRVRRPASAGVAGHAVAVGRPGSPDLRDPVGCATGRRVRQGGVGGLADRRRPAQVVAVAAVAGRAEGAAAVGVDDGPQRRVRLPFGPARQVGRVGGARQLPTREPHPQVRQPPHRPRVTA